MKERKVKQRLAKKRSNSKDNHVANKVLVSSKRTGKRQVVASPVKRAGLHPYSTRWPSRGVGKAQKRKERASRASLKRKVAKGEVDLDMGLAAEALPQAPQASAAPVADSMQE